MSPSKVGLNAKIISSISPSLTLSTKLSILRFSGPTPSMGEINPPITWNNPL